MLRAPQIIMQRLQKKHPPRACLSRSGSKGVWLRLAHSNSPNARCCCAWRTQLARRAAMSASCSAAAVEPADTDDEPMLSNEPPEDGGRAAAGPPPAAAAAGAGWSPIARWRRLVFRRRAWWACVEAWIIPALAPSLPRPQQPSSHSHMCLQDLHSYALRAPRPAPRVAGHQAPGQGRRDAARRRPPPAPAGAPVTDLTTPRAAAHAGPGAQAVPPPPVRWAADIDMGPAVYLAPPTGRTTAVASRPAVRPREPPVPEDAAAPRCDCRASDSAGRWPAEVRLALGQGSNRGRRFWLRQRKQCLFFEWIDPAGPETFQGRPRVAPASAAGVPELTVVLPHVDTRHQR